MRVRYLEKSWSVRKEIIVFLSNLLEANRNNSSHADKCGITTTQLHRKYVHNQLISYHFLNATGISHI